MMIELVKEQEYNLSQNHLTLKSANVDVSWDVIPVDNEFGSGNDEEEPHDLDVSAFLVNGFRKIRSEDDFVFYNNKETDDFTVTLKERVQGSTLTDSFHLKLSEISFDIAHVVFSLSIHNALDRMQNFGRIKDVVVKVSDADTNDVLVRYVFPVLEYSNNNAVTFGEFYRIGADWVFKAIGQGYDNGLGDIAREFDVNVRGE